MIQLFSRKTAKVDFLKSDMYFKRNTIRWDWVLHKMPLLRGSGSSEVKNLPAVWEMQVQSLGREDPWRRKWQPTPVFLPGESHGHRCLADYSPWGCKRVWHNLVTKALPPFTEHLLCRRLFPVLVSGTYILRTEIIDIFQKQIYKWFPFLGVTASWWGVLFFEVCFFQYLREQQFNQMRRPEIKIVAS